MRAKHLLRCALADLEGIMPEFEPSGDREHPAWKTMDEIRELLNIGDEPAEKRCQAWTAYAQERYNSEDINVDDDTIVSEGDDDGAWVLAWVWVDYEVGMDIDLGDDND